MPREVRPPNHRGVDNSQIKPSLFGHAPSQPLRICFCLCIRKSSIFVPVLLCLCTTLWQASHRRNAARVHDPRYLCFGCFTKQVYSSYCAWPDDLVLWIRRTGGVHGCHRKEAVHPPKDRRPVRIRHEVRRLDGQPLTRTQLGRNRQYGSCLALVRLVPHRRDDAVTMGKELPRQSCPNVSVRPGNNHFGRHALSRFVCLRSWGQDSWILGLLPIIIPPSKFC